MARLARLHALEFHRCRSIAGMFGFEHFPPLFFLFLRFGLIAGACLSLTGVAVISIRRKQGARETRIDVEKERNTEGG